MVKIILLFILHLFADFLLQGSSLSKLKSSKSLYLLIHVIIYTSVFIVFSPLLLSLTFIDGLIFSGINGGIHLVVDFITSKLKRIFWQKNEAIYVSIIIFDTIIHIIILLTTYMYLFPEAFNTYIRLD